MSRLMAAVKKFFRDEEGATAVEYGLLIALIAAVIVGVVAALGTQLQDEFESVADCIESGDPCENETEPA